MKKVLGAFSRFVSKNEAVSCEVQTHFGSFHLAKFIRKSFGRIITIYVSKNGAV